MGGDIGPKEGDVTAWDFRLGPDQASFAAELDRLAASDLVNRIWRRDFTVWSHSPAEICNRLGWLDIHERMKAEVPALQGWAQQMYARGLRQAVVIGMGGSSLAPEVFSALVPPGNRACALQLYVLDSTDPAQIAELNAKLDLTRTLFLVATKSGGTVETLSGYSYYRDRLQHALPAREVGRRFVGITDPGSSLTELARQDGWQRIFENDPDIGGRYSALSFFGLAPLALLGADVARFLGNVDESVRQAQLPLVRNPAAQLGVFMAFQAARGRDKLTLLLPSRLAPLGDWLEQLVAESLGKTGKGILPVLGEGAEDVPCFGDDRCCVVVAPSADCDDPGTAMAELAAQCVRAGHPTAVLPGSAPGYLGRDFFQWEFAVAVAGHCLGVHPFDQPDVESAKSAARIFLNVFAESGELPRSETVPPQAEYLQAFLEQAETGDYVSLQAYLPLNGPYRDRLESLRRVIGHSTRMATTVGIGPRFLHSTGQMHKGGPNSGLFIQFVREPKPDFDIPALQTVLSFGTLQAAQAMGDAAALRRSGRRVLRMQLGQDPLADLERLTAALAGAALERDKAVPRRDR